MAVYLIVALLVEVNITVEELNEELNLCGEIHALTGDASSLLQAIHHALSISHLASKIKKILVRLLRVLFSSFFFLILVFSMKFIINWGFGVLRYLAKNNFLLLSLKIYCTNDETEAEASLLAKPNRTINSRQACPPYDFP